MKSILYILLICLTLFSYSKASTINVPADQPWIQAAIDISVNGDTVLVADGLYVENINFKGKSIIVASHFLIDEDSSHISNTIIDGSIPINPDSGSVVYFISGEDTNSVLCGFTIEGGSGTIATWSSEIHRYAGGILCASGGKIINNIIINNIVDDNVDYASGGGILAGWWWTEYVIIENNKIESNTVSNVNPVAGGGISFYCSGKIINNKILDNTINSTFSGGVGGGVSCLGRDTLVISVDIINNYFKNNRIICNGNSYGNVHGGGIQYARASGNIRGNYFKYNSLSCNNKAYGGGIFINACPLTYIENNLISSNTINGAVNSFGAGLSYYSQYVDGKTFINNNIIVFNEAINGQGGGINFGSELEGDAVLFNNTIAYNKADLTGGGIATYEYPVGKIFNSILWGNEAASDSQIYFYGVNSVLDVFYCDVQGNDVWTGTGNFNIDPLFVCDDSLFNLMCSSDTSICLNKGIDSIEINGNWYCASGFDFGGNSRPLPLGTLPDIGAWEYDVVNSFQKNNNDIIPFEFIVKQNFPNPFNLSTIIEFDLPEKKRVKLEIFNMLGEKITTLLNKYINSGKYKLEFVAEELPSGVYLYRIKAGRFQQTKKMILLK